MERINMCRLLHGNNRYSYKEFEKFEPLDTICGDASTPDEIKIWSEKDFDYDFDAMKETAMEELEGKFCSETYFEKLLKALTTNLHQRDIWLIIILVQVMRTLIRLKKLKRKLNWVLIIRSSQLTYSTGRKKKSLQRFRGAELNQKMMMIRLKRLAAVSTVSG